MKSVIFSYIIYLAFSAWLYEFTIFERQLTRGKDKVARNYGGRIKACNSGRLRKKKACLDNILFNNAHQYRVKSSEKVTGPGEKKTTDTAFTCQ